MMKLEMLKSVAGRQVPFTPRQFPIRLSRRVGLRTMPSIGGKKPWIWNPTVATGSLVGTSTTSTATLGPYQRKIFYAEGLFWVFYSNGTDLVYKTSNDGINWSSEAVIRACPYGYKFSCVFDGTYLHYVVGAAVDWNLYYRRGIPNSDGSITWSASEQTVFVGSSGNYHREPTITVDSLGYVWLGTDQVLAGSFYPWAWKNANKDGTWANAPGFPYRLNASSSDWRTTVVPLTSGKVYFIYVSTYSPYICGRLYDGSWQPEEANFTQYLPEADGPDNHSVVADGDTVYFAYIRRTTYQIRLCKRTTTWQAEQLIQDGVDEYCGAVLCISAPNLYCFWGLSDNHIYYKKCINGVWDATPTDWLHETVDHLTPNYAGTNVITSFYQSAGIKIGIAYLTRTSSPYKVKFAY
jgi:hypothetical protein